MKELKPYYFQMYRTTTDRAITLGTIGYYRWTTKQVHEGSYTKMNELNEKFRLYSIDNLDAVIGHGMKYFRIFAESEKHAKELLRTKFPGINDVGTSPKQRKGLNGKMRTVQVKDKYWSYSDY